MLSKTPKMIHISCHGFPNTANNMKDNYANLQDEGDFLLLEHEQYIGEMVSEKRLRKIISNVWETELVVLAACDSEFAAKIFLKKGARHVVCIEESKEILDKAVLTFTNTFYRSVFDGLSICEAYSISKNLTSNMHSHSEANKFKLMMDTASGPHSCLPIQLNADREFKNISAKILVCEIPAKIENLLFREKEMAKLIQKLNDGERMIFVIGLFGIGKSWIARNVLHFMKERKYFCGGLLFVALNGIRTIGALCHQLCGLIVKNLLQTPQTQAEFERIFASPDEMINFFVEFFNNETKFVLKKVEKYNGIDLFKNERSKKYLVCFDNAEDLIDIQPDPFKELLNRLLNSCPDL